MDQEIDPYLELLGIPKSEQPPNCYRLLGIPEYTANKQVIANGAARQMQFLRRVGGDQYLTQVQKILNEISKVRILLLDDKKRAEYDRTLKEKERAKAGGSPTGSESDSMFRSPSPSQSKFDLLAPIQRELGNAAAIELMFLSGPRVGTTVALRSRDVTLGPSSRYDVMLPTRNGASFKLQHEIDQWVLTSEGVSFAVNGRLINGLTTVKDGDILRFSADGPDLQFIEEVDLTQILGTLGKYENVVNQSRASHSAIVPGAPARRSHSGTASRRNSNQPNHSGQRTASSQRSANSQQSAHASQGHQSRLVRKPDSQKSQGIGGSIMALANRALGRDAKFTKKTGMVFDWQIGVFWLAVGATLASIIALIAFAVGSQ